MIRHMMRGSRSLAALALSIGFLLTPAVADDGSEGDGAPLAGRYGLTEFRAAGVYSGGEEAEARGFIGRAVTIHGDHVALPTGELCHIGAGEPVTLRDGWESFGSAGGSWSELGLAQGADGGYAATEIAFDCEERFWGLLVQPETETYLLKVWAVYLVMQPR
jgi:hypothetical protein